MKKNLFLLFAVFASLSMNAQVLVKGVVKAADDGQPMVGVSVFEKGTLNGVVTDIDGQYSITVSSDNAVLAFSSLGFKTTEVAVGDKRVIDLTMDVDNQLLDEVIVMGYSSKTRGEITAAVTTVTSDKLQDVVSNNIGDMLQGKVAGVSVVKSSGAPGDEPSIRIRGTSSMNASSDPLYVVDGIIGGSFDPNDVETVTVLKDAGATGMYGAQANGGVIVVTTKKGKSDKIQFNFKANFGLVQPDFSRQQLMNANQLYTYYREYFRDPETYLIDDFAFLSEMPREMLKTDTKWRDLIVKNGFLQNYHFSLSGKTERNTYYSSVSYYSEDGTLKNTGYQSVNVRSNNSFKLTNWLNLTANINLTAAQRKSTDDLLVYYIDQNIPFDSPYNEAGELRSFKNEPIYGRYDVNPMIAYDSDAIQNNSRSFGADADFVLDVKIFPWLSFVSQNRLAASVYNSHYHRFSYVEYMQGGDSIQETMGINYGGITTNMFKAEGKWGKHTLNGLAGYEAQMSWSRDVGAYGEGLPYGLAVPDVASANPSISGTTAQSGMQSIITQANYNYDQRYFLTASFRVDQSSTFNKQNRTAMFPSVSAAWVVSNEEFFDSKVISNLKLKASWGKTGMKDIGASKYLEAFAYSSQYNNSSAAIATQMANQDLKWEQTTQINAGVELGITDRISLDLNWYHNKTSDLLIYRDLPPTGGFSNQWQNLGGVVNTGVEAAVSATPIKTSDFQWNVDFSIAYNKNYLCDFGEGVTIYKSNSHSVAQVYRDGVPMYTWYLREYAGVDPQTGRNQYIDENGNKTFDYSSARFREFGTPLIPWEGGIGTSIRWRNFKFSATGNFVWGNTIYGRSRASGLTTFISNSLLPSNEDVIWRQPGDNATIALPALGTESVYHSGGLVNGDYFKLRNVTLSYTLPKKIMKDNTLTFSLSCDNVFTLTNLWGADPEVEISGSGVVGTTESIDNRYPNKRQYNFQINFSF